MGIVLSKSWKGLALLTAVFLGLAALLFAIFTPKRDAYVELRNTAPDSLAVFALNKSQRKTLTRWSNLWHNSDPDTLKQWVKTHYSPLVNIGLRLSEQATLFRHRGQDRIGAAKLDSGRGIGQALAKVVQDTFLLKQVQFIENLDDERLLWRAKACLAYAQARNFRVQNEISKARKEYEKVVKFSKQAGDKKLQTDALVFLQWFLHLAKKHELVIGIEERIRTLTEEIGYKQRLAQSLFQVADTYQTLDNLPAAQAAWEEAAQITKQMGDYRALVGRYYSQSRQYTQMGSYLQARQVLERLLKIDHEKIYYGLAKLSLGDIDVLLGEYSRAQNAYEQAVDFFQQQDDYLNQIKTINHSSFLKSLLGEYEQALELANRALELKKDQIILEEVALVKSNMGSIYFKMGNLGEAQSMHRQAIELFQKGSSVSRFEAEEWLNLANVQLKRGELVAADESIKNADSIAISIDNKLLAIESRMLHGNLSLQKGQLQQASEEFYSVLQDAQALNTPNLVADAYWRLSNTEARLHHFREAIYCVDQAIAFSEKLRTNIFDDLQRVTYFATTQEMFDLAANLALKTGDAFLAFQYAEQARSRALLDAIDKATIKSLKARNVDLEQGTSLSLQTIRAKMPAAVQIVEYRITPDSLLLWLIDANSFVQKSIPVASVSLQKRVHDFLRSIGSEDLAALQARVRQDIKGVYDENRQLGKQLFQLIFKPIAGKIAAESAIIIIPDGVLYSLPFGALVTDDDLFFDQKYLWGKAPSVTVLTKNASLQADALETGQPKFLMVAGALPSSKNEKRQIKQYYKNAVVLEEESATYGNLNEKLRQGAHIAYFTVHSVADVRSPMNSFIELYDQQTANGRLKPTPIYARRLLDLDFSRTWLAVLNGCETAKGKITRGEGALNMVRIFSMANVPVVVASLWQNDDRRSAQIMGAFFKKIASGHLTPARALKEAKEQAVNLLRQEHEFPLPYFWAVFEVYENSWLN